MVIIKMVYTECSEDESHDEEVPDVTSDKLEPLRSKTPQRKPPSVCCGLCRASFSRQEHLKRHMQCLHSKFTFCKCPVCDTQFANEAAVKTHVKATHRKSTTFKCRVCQTVFRTFNLLGKHEVVHEIERHECPECGNRFKRRDHMLRHVKSQHLNQHEVCPHCGQTLRRKDHLTKHLREKHAMV